MHWRAVAHFHQDIQCQAGSLVSCRALKIPLPQTECWSPEFLVKIKISGNCQVWGESWFWVKTAVVFFPLVSIPSTALPETWLSFPSRIRDVFMFRGLSGNVKPGEFGRGWALAGTGMCLREGTSRTYFCRHFVATGLK